MSGWETIGFYRGNGWKWIEINGNERLFVLVHISQIFPEFLLNRSAYWNFRPCCDILVT